MSAEASTEFGNGEVGTGNSSGCRHCELLGRLFNSTRSNPSGNTAVDRISQIPEREYDVLVSTYGTRLAL